MKSRNGIKSMRTAGLIFAGAVFAGVLALPAMAQDMQDAPPPPPPAHGDHGGGGRAHMKEMADKLGLTPDQQKVFRDTMMDERTKMKALREDTTLDRKAKHEQMMAIHQDAEAKRRAVLTDDQKPKYDAWVAENREKMKERRGGGAGTPGDDAPPPPPPPPAE